MARAPTILIAMPLFEGWDLVGEALDSIKRQTYPHYRVLISVDGGDERSFAACRQYTEDPRFNLVLQPKRLRWEGNMNWLAGQLREDFFCYWQHDDYCHPDYLRVLVAHAARHPEASSVYCDMQCVGTKNHVIRYESRTGFALERVLGMVRDYNAAVIRCLVRAAAMRASTPMKQSAIWAVALARAGELHRVPQALYFRRFRPDSLNQYMKARPQEILWPFTLEFGLGVLEVALPLVRPEEETRLFSVIADRIIYHRPLRDFQYDFRAVDRGDRLRFVADFLRASHSQLGVAPFPELLARDDPRPVLQQWRTRYDDAAIEGMLIDTILADLAAFHKRRSASQRVSQFLGKSARRLARASKPRGLS